MIIIDNFYNKKVPGYPHNIMVIIMIIDAVLG